MRKLRHVGSFEAHFLLPLLALTGFPLERVQQITRAVQNQVVLVRNGSSQGPGHQSDPADLLELAG